MRLCQFCHKDFFPKTCTKCAVEHCLCSYAKQKANRDGLTYWCRGCRSDYARAKRDEPGFKEKKRENSLRFSYGIGIQVYQKMHEAQKGLCAICHEPETKERNGKRLTLCVDHCHKTGEVRRLLCNRCNLMLGLARDNPEILREAASYVEREVKNVTIQA